jgi:hypothetical protein
MYTMTSTLNASATTPAPEIDINSLLTHMKTVEGDKEKLLQQVQIMQEKIGKLTEGKKAEMQKALDTVIADWLKESVNDEAVREEFRKGMSRLVDQTAEESGVWRVVCCASNLHAERLKELETLRTEVSTLKNNTISSFNDSRKRPFDEINRDKGPGDQPEMNIWEEFANTMKGRVYEPTI